MKIIRQKPPIWDKLEKAFNVKWGTIVVAYGDTLYCGDEAEITRDILIHEAVHLKRQNGKPETWYEDYIRDTKFRFGEELLAYRAQYQFLKEAVKDRNELMRRLIRLSQDLGGEMYGNVVTSSEARKLISM